MHEVSQLRYKYEEDGEGKGDEGYEEDDDLPILREDDGEHRQAAGVGDLDYGERVRKAAAPLMRVEVAK